MGKIQTFPGCGDHPAHRGILPPTLAVNLGLRPKVRCASMLVRYAAPSPAGSGDCSTWADACSLQTALAVALPGDARSGSKPVCTRPPRTLPIPAHSSR